MAKVIQARDVPEDVYAELVKQAAARGMSLNKYVNAEFERIARRGRNAEIFARAHERAGTWPSGAEIVATVREARDQEN